MTDNTIILAKITKLRQMTTQNGCSEAEANLAFVHMSRLMAEYNISEAQLGHHITQKDFCHQAFAYPFGSRAWTQANRAIERLCGVKFWTSSDEDEILGKMNIQNCYGAPTDVAAAMALAEVCLLAIATETERYRKTKTSHRKNIDEFQSGMAARLAYRIDELREAAPGQALVVHRKAMVFEAWTTSPYYVRGSLQRVQPNNGNSYYAGIAAGNNVRLGHAKEVSGTRAIGHSR